MRLALKSACFGACRWLVALGLVLGQGVATAAAKNVGEAAAAKPVAVAVAAGRYRCYQPPTYTVTAWFDLESDGSYRLNGGAPQRFAYDPARALIRWSGGDFASRRLFGIYMPPGKPGADEDRVTIVLSKRADMRPARKGWEVLERCYLTMH